MSSLSQAPASSLHSGSILDVALNEYRKNTGKDLLSHPLAIELQRCDSVESDGILAILQRQANTFEKQCKDGNRGLMKWIRSSVYILYSFSAIIGDGVGLMFPPAKPIFTGIGILLAAAKDVSASHDVLLDLFRRVGDFFERFEVYIRSFLNTKVSEALVNVVVKIMNILSIATKEIEQSRTRRFFNKLGGKRDIEDALGELENLIQGEHYMPYQPGLYFSLNIHRPDMEAVGAAVQQIKNKGGKEERQKIQKETREWFSPPNPSINHNIAWKVYHAGSATWVCGHSVFTDWMSAGSLLWVHGKPGSGKSILCSAIIQHIMALCEAGQASIAYFYFDFRDKEKQNVRNLVTSLLFQLFAFSDPCCDIIRRVYSAHGNGTRQPTNDVLANCLKEMLTVVAEHPIYIIMDALDECPDHSGWPTAREEVLVILKDLVGLHLPNLR
ncbi:hypothetical protein EDB92DRAFT_682783 [Lactarius akahatsu]|uniref:NACHT domain-containing protein n=1 Tax=Lactarius akahatsu TaxID=416441 RepID=A0AAD4LL24_9AGAM|nr:hypothetical protein EDB92DRAFT_682783 [Lactarius akahatsu]